MAEVEYRPNAAGLRAMLNSPEMCAAVTGVANEIAERANGMYAANGYEVSPGRPGKKRCHAIVYTGDMHSVNSNRVHNTLQKSLG
jgi:hypothetical protein